VLAYAKFNAKMSVCFFSFYFLQLCCRCGVVCVCVCVFIILIRSFGLFWLHFGVLFLFAHFVLFNFLFLMNAQYL